LFTGESMFTGRMAAEMAAYKTQDLVRDAEAQRLSSSVRAAHVGPGGTAVRRLMHGVVALGRFFHVAHPEVQQGLLGQRGWSSETGV